MTIGSSRRIQLADREASGGISSSAARGSLWRLFGDDGFSGGGMDGQIDLRHRRCGVGRLDDLKTDLRIVRRKFSQNIRKQGGCRQNA